MNIEFSKNQQKIITTGLTMLSLVVILLALFWFLKGVAGFLTAFSGVFVPLTAFFVVFWRLAKDKYIREWI